MKHTLVTTLVSALAVTSAFGQVAYDSAGDVAYDDGWQAGDNGGYGWQPWILSTAGHYVGDSNANGSGGGPGINTSGPNTSGRSFGGNSGTEIGIRHMLAPMTIGSTLIVDLDASFANNPLSNLTFVISDTAFNPLYLSMNSPLGIQSNDNFGNLKNISLGASDGGYRYAVTYTSATSYAATLTILSNGSSTNWTGTLLAAPESISYFLSRDINDSTDHQFINSLTVVPEPVSTVAIGGALVGLIARRRRHNK